MNFPKFMILQTGGLAVGAISTRSRLASRAFWRASAIATTPSGSPSSPISRTSFHRIWSLIRIDFLSIFHLRSELTALRLDRAPGNSEKLFHTHGAGVTAVPQPDRDGAGRGFLLPDDEHRRDLGELRLSDPSAELFVPLVDLDAQPARSQLPLRRPRRLREAVGHREDDRLHGREPEGEVPGGVLDQDAEEPLDGAQDRAMQHDGPVGLAILADVRQVEALGLRRVVLHRAELPGPADRVLHAKVDLRAVEVPVARRELIGPTDRLQRGLEGLLRAIPVLVRAHPARRPEADRDFHVVEPEGRVDRVEKLDERVDLRLHLVGRDVDVRVVLRERPDPRQPRRHPGALVAVEPAEVSQPDGQVAVRPVALLEQEVMSRAVHRLDAELPLVDLREVHVVAVVVVVPRDAEEVRVEDLRGDDLVVAAARVLRPEVGKESVVESRPLREEERRRGRELVERDEVELATVLSVVARLRVLQSLEVGVELFLREKRGPVDALEHRVLLVPLPIGAGRVRELEYAQPAGRGDVRAAAEVDELALAVERLARAIRLLTRDLDLVGIVVDLDALTHVVD